LFSGHDRSNVVNGESKSTSIHIPDISTCKKDHEGKFNKLIILLLNKFLIEELQSNSEQYPSLTCKYI